MQQRTRLWMVGVLAMLASIIIYFAITFNRLVKQEEEVKRTWSEMQNAYMRRFDLIPSLVSVVKGTAAYEQQVLAEITAARSKATDFQFAEKDLSFQNDQQQQAAQSALSTSMNKCLAVIESYPELKGTKSFLYLQSQLEGTERRIKVARKDFNAAIQTYNTACRSFPSSLVATLTGFKYKQGFEAVEGAERNKEVNF